MRPVILAIMILLCATSCTVTVRDETIDPEHIENALNDHEQSIQSLAKSAVVSADAHNKLIDRVKALEKKKK